MKLPSFKTAINIALLASTLVIGGYELYPAVSNAYSYYFYQYEYQYQYQAQYSYQYQYQYQYEYQYQTPPTIMTTSAGTPTTLRGRANNIGASPAGTFQNIFQIDSGPLIAASSITSVAAGSDAVFTATYTFSTPGNYSVRACADDNTSWAGTIFESNEDNNCSDWSTVVVTSGIQCADGIDNDGNGLTDYPADPGCSSAGDTVEHALPTASLSASPSSIAIGSSSTLTWSSTNATSCTGTNFSTGSETSGSVSVSPSSSTTYTVTCTGTGGSANASQTVTIGTCGDGIDNNSNGLTDYPADPACSSVGGTEGAAPDAALTLTASKNPVSYNTTATLNWSVTNTKATTCTLRGDNGDSWSLSGSSGTKTTAKLTNETRYTLACTDLNNLPAATTLIMKVTPKFQEF